MLILAEEVTTYCMKGFKKLFPSSGNGGSTYIKLKMTRTVNFFFWMNSCSAVNLLVEGLFS